MPMAVSKALATMAIVKKAGKAGCGDSIRVSPVAGIGDEMPILRNRGTGGANVFVRSGGTIVELDVLSGGAASQTAIPGGDARMTATTKAALGRAQAK